MLLFLCFDSERLITVETSGWLQRRHLIYCNCATRSSTSNVRFVLSYRTLKEYIFPQIKRALKGLTTAPNYANVLQKTVGSLRFIDDILFAYSCPVRLNSDVL